ncbi:MAG: hypothetical protein HYW45_03395 [Candidatus Daviesbacteria bacterium]|nr:MAG: hypothetical protein HYW45_03395 [Candidatus Daviesbacteria bacterium]
MLDRPLSPKIFVISQILILLLGLVFVGGLYYVLNVQYQSSTTPFLSGPVTSAPKSLSLEVTDPSDNRLVFKTNLLVSGKTLPHLKVLISTSEQDQVVTSSASGSFSASLTLNEGPNKISVTVFSDSGEEKTIIKNVFYLKEQI